MKFSPPQPFFILFVFSVMTWLCGSVTQSLAQLPPPAAGEMGRQSVEEQREVLARIAAQIEREEYAEALVALRTAPLSDVARESLTGYLMWRAGDMQQAQEHFGRATELAPDRPILWLYLAQAHGGAGAWGEARAALTRCEPLEASEPLVWTLRARAWRMDQNSHEALEAAWEGLARFPVNVELLREGLLVLLEAQVFEGAMPWVARFMSVSELDWDRWLLGEVAIERGAWRAATMIYELSWQRGVARDEARARDAAQLGVAYARRGLARTSARWFVRAGEVEGEWGFEVADQLRVAGSTDEALRWSGRQASSAEQRAQRFDILAEGARWERAIAAGEELARRGELSARQQYRLAYALYAVGRAGEAREALSEIAGVADVASEREALWQKLERCAPTPAGCP